MEYVIATLNHASLDGSGLRRDLPPGFIETTMSLEDCYDWTTLWYDAIWTGRQLVLITPLLFNLEAVLRTGIAVDGRSIGPERILHRRAHSEVWLNVKTRPKEVSLQAEGTVHRTQVSDTAGADFFKGCNTLVTMQQNNDLAWIRDVIRYYRKVHRLDAVLIFDNESSAYGLDDIAETALSAGLERLMVVQAPFRFGANGGYADGTRSWRGMSLQCAALNIARLRFLGGARAVLQCDIDELVWCRKRDSIFDQTRRHPLGYVQFPLNWRYAKMSEGQKPTHFDHVWKRSVPDGSPAKYCIRPRGPLWWASWDVHQLHRLGARGKLLSRRAGAWHMKQLTTNWKPADKRMTLPDDLVYDPEIAEFMTRHGFQTAPENGSP